MKTRLLLLGLLALLLSACAHPGDTRSADASARDVRIARAVRQALDDNPRIYARHIEINVYDGVVTLSGFVFDGNDMNDAVRIASEVPGVTSVGNDMQVQVLGPDRSRRR